MTAKDLLYQILDYRHIWSLPQYIGTDSAKARLARIHALQDAFGISKKYADPTLDIRYNGVDRATHLQRITDLDYLLRGGFLHDRPLENNRLLIEKMRAKIDHLFERTVEFSIRDADVSWLFNDLFNYRQELFKLSYPWSGMLEGFSPGLHYSKSLQKDLNQAITLHVYEIDRVLWLILDPRQRDISIEELTSVFKYDPSDLSGLDTLALSEY